MADWSVFYTGYVKAYQYASQRAQNRIKAHQKIAIQYKTHDRVGKSEKLRIQLPKSLYRLEQMVRNLWWSYQPDLEQLLKPLDPYLWQTCSGNPVHFLGSVSEGLMHKKQEDAEFLEQMDRCYEQFQKKILAPKEGVQGIGLVAYFSMEYGLHECLPIYSGGLGILSGDHLKTASDLGVPLIAVGLLYRRGYFRQSVNHQGVQITHYPFIHMSYTPCEPRDENLPLIEVELPGRFVYVTWWTVNVGRVTLYLLDTDISMNTPSDRQLTHHLYGKDRFYRIQQEIILGVAGQKLMETLDLNPTVYHINEGHSAFLCLQRMVSLRQTKTVAGAIETIRQTTVFTTHTPVPAGNEEFSEDLIKWYLSDLIEKTGMPFDQFLLLSKETPLKTNFSMTVFALNLARRSNAVSQLHGEVARKMWAQVEVTRTKPIISITNGVHVATWIGSEIKRWVMGKISDAQLSGIIDEKTALGVQSLDDQALWQAHQTQKRSLLEDISVRVVKEYGRRGESNELIDHTLKNLEHPNVLLVGFARRFAQYKRADLIFSDLERVISLMNDPYHPFFIVFSGKSHPNDLGGAQIIQDIFGIIRNKDVRGRVIFLEDYDINVSRPLVQGVDVWLNTPQYPREASGTSGMKVILNGGLHCSILDGWWKEGYDPSLGFEIPHEHYYKDSKDQIKVESRALYRVFETQILPLYYQKDGQGFSEKWVAMMKASIQLGLETFSSHRMLQDYCEQMYAPQRVEELQFFS